MSKYIYWLKKDLFGCFRIEEIRDKDNETGLKVGGGIEMSIYSAFPYTRCIALFAFDLLTFRLTCFHFYLISRWIIFEIDFYFLVLIDWTLST